MKKGLNLVLAIVMVLSLVFIGDIASSNNPFAAQAQTKVSVKKKSSGGLYGKSKSGVKYIYRKGRNGTVYVYRKGRDGTVYVGKKSYQGGKYVAGKTVQGTKYIGKKTVNGTKSIFRKTKKVVVGQ
jgi:hypothetical protein